MLLNLSTIRGRKVAASDGNIGSVSDILFDDISWMIRWLVVDTGDWLSGRKILLPPAALGHAEPTAKTFPVRLTKAEVEASPELDTHRPVSRQFETSTYDHYGWSPYWGSGFYLGGTGMTGGGLSITGDTEATSRGDELDRLQQGLKEPHLRSAQEVTGYRIHAADGEIGHLADLILEDTDWNIYFLIVDTSNWWIGQKVLISPRLALDIRWAEQLIYLDVDRKEVMDSPPFKPVWPVDPAYEKRMTWNYVELPPRSNPDRKTKFQKGG